SYTKANIYYTKCLHLGEDADALHNLKMLTLLSDKNDASLGIAHPKSQDASSTKSESQEKKETTRDEDKPSSGSSSAGENVEEKTKNKEEMQKKKTYNKLLDNQKPEEHPLGSKVYELINKGYIRETQPW
ncbi:MAG: VWA domain-containing protein, partial [Campylobacterota bacterium]|nr:VWA domain-containing protein [Campylobacterota bacterium]